MKTTFFVLTMLSMVASAHAETLSELNAQKLAALQAGRIGTMWTCEKDGNPEALVIFRVKPELSWATYGTVVLAVQDTQICQALNVTCPFVGGTGYYSTLPEIRDRQFSHTSITGKFSDGVAFFSDGAGMKATGMYTGSNVRVDWGSNWYFQSGQCRAHQL